MIPFWQVPAGWFVWSSRHRRWYRLDSWSRAGAIVEGVTWAVDARALVYAIPRSLIEAFGPIEPLDD